MKSLLNVYCLQYISKVVERLLHSVSAKERPAASILDMKVLESFVFFLALAYGLASPVSNAASSTQCGKIFSDAGISQRFAATVAHGIHSLTVDDLRMFEPDATENNQIPTVNVDLKSDVLILPNAPDRKMEGKSFKTDGMKAVDQVLSHMDDNNYDIKNYNALERVVHALHMQESSLNAFQQYRKLQASPPSLQVCQCARDVENNGVLQFLHFLALSVRDPAMMASKRMTLNNVTVTWGLGGVMRIVPNANAPLGPDDELVPLKDQAAWQRWRKVMLHFESHDGTDDYELALYLYCALRVK